jgi:hypothetical protein
MSATTAVMDAIAPDQPTATKARLASRTYHSAKGELIAGLDFIWKSRRIARMRGLQEYQPVDRMSEARLQLVRRFAAAAVLAEQMAATATIKKATIGRSAKNRFMDHALKKLTGILRGPDHIEAGGSN